MVVIWIKCLNAFVQVSLDLPRYGLGLALNITEWSWPWPCGLVNVDEENRG